MDILLSWTPYAIIALLLLSAFFSGSETALTAASRARMHALEKDGAKGAKRVNALISDQEGLIGSILLGNNLVNILATSLATSFFLKVVGESGVAIATAVMTILVLVFAEVLPKTYAINNADKFAMGVSRPVKTLVWLFRPGVVLLQAVVRVNSAFRCQHCSCPILSTQIHGAATLARALVQVELSEELVRDSQGRIMIIRRHGNRFAGRILGTGACASVTDAGLSVDCGERRFGPVHLDLDEPQAWAEAINRLSEGSDA